MAECTFAPRTGRAPLGPYAQRQSLPVVDRLLLATGGHHNSRSKVSTAQRHVEEREEAQRAACTFKPQLSSKPPESLLKNGEYKPIHRRLDEEWRRKETVLAQARAKADREATFQPEINSLSRRLAARRRQSDKVSLFKKAKPTHGQQDHSFKPVINATSERLLEMSTSVPSDFQRRQRMFERRREARREFVATSVDAGTVTFRPATSANTSLVLALSDRRFHQVIETPEERWSRMAFGESAERDARLRALQTQARNELSFAPQLNPRSLHIAQARKLSSDGRTRNGGSLMPQESFGRQQPPKMSSVEEEVRKECTFFPDTRKPRVIGYYEAYEVPPPKAHLSIGTAAAEGLGPDVVLERIKEHQRSKEIWAARQREEEEQRQLKVCTFQPDLSKSHEVKMPQGPVEVAGLDRFLEMKALAERQRAELQIRAEKAFLLRPSSPRHRGPTVPRPFNLSSGSRGRVRDSGDTRD